MGIDIAHGLLGGGDYEIARLPIERGLDPAPRLFEYRFTSYKVWRETGAWWFRQPAAELVPAMRLRTPAAGESVA